MTVRCDDGVRAAGHVRYAVLDGYVVILDLRAGNYIALDEHASADWIRLLEHVGPRTLSGDEAAFFDRCERRGYLTRAAAARRGKPTIVRRVPMLPLVAYAIFALIAMDKRLKKRGFAREYDNLSRLAPRASSETRAEVLRAESAIAFAENFTVAQVTARDCLPRSLAIYRTLLQGGLAPIHRIGVSRLPFEAHAWVECGGKVIRDADDFVRRFTVIAELR
jgi:hypothetical protein